MSAPPVLEGVALQDLDAALRAVNPYWQRVALMTPDGQLAGHYVRFDNPDAGWDFQPA